MTREPDSEFKKTIHYAVKCAALIIKHELEKAQFFLNTLAFEDVLRLIGVQDREKPYNTYVRLRGKYHEGK